VSALVGLAIGDNTSSSKGILMSHAIHLPLGPMREIRFAVSRGIKRSNLCLPSMSISEVFDEPIDLRLIDLEQTNGNTTIQEQILILSLARRHNVRRAFELGTFDGKTSANLAANLGAKSEILLDIRSGNPT
jgi:hypothetical protein